MRWPFVARSAYDLALQQLRELRERNDRLTEAVSRSKQGDTQVIMPRETLPLEFSPGWWDNSGVVKETKHVQS